MQAARRRKRIYQRSAETIGRVVNVTPRHGDVFYMRILLHHIPGATSFLNLRTINGVLCDTYQECCRRRGLLMEDNEWELIMQEASISQIRELFVSFLLFCEPAHPAALYERHALAMGEDYAHMHPDQPAVIVRSLVLWIWNAACNGLVKNCATCCYQQETSSTALWRQSLR